MRHLIGIVLAIVMAGVLFFAGAWGYLKLTSGPLRALPPGGGSLLSDHRVLLAMAAVAGTGLLAGILIAAPRISPLAAGLPGLVLLAWTVLYLVSVHRAVHLIPLKSHPYGAGFEAMLAAGILGAAGLAMIVPMFVPSRWRSRPRAGEPEPGQAGELVPGLADTTDLPVAGAGAGTGQALQPPTAGTEYIFPPPSGGQPLLGASRGHA
jgi:hypothetical protein